MRQTLLIDVTRLVDRTLQGLRPTGVDRVGLAYVAHFRSQAEALVRFAGRWLVFDETDSQSLFDWLLAPDVRQAKRIRWLVARVFALNWRRPKPGSILINTSHGGLERSDYVRRVQRDRLRPFYFLHDLIPLAFPEYGRSGEAQRHRNRLATIFSTAHGVIANSEDTGHEFVSYAQQLGVRVPPWVVAHLALPAFPPSMAKRPLPEAYFVMLATIEPRKNHLLLLNLWRQMVRELDAKTPRLVLIGRRGWECEQVLDMLDRCAVLRDYVHEVSGCDDATLATWLTHAQALLFPSFAEGFGIPLVEALGLGTPVIASDLPVFREVAGDIPDYLDPLDGVGWRQTILDYAALESPRRLAQLSRMVEWHAPDWSSHFEKVEKFMAGCAH